MGNIKKVRNLLIVEDSDDDYEAIERIVIKVNAENYIHRCKTAKDALDYLQKKGPYENANDVKDIDIMFLDLNMPGMDGRDLLRIIRKDSCYKTLPVLVMTNSDYKKDIEECYEIGANCYVKKPIEYDDFKFAYSHLAEFWLNAAQLPGDER